MLQRVAFAVLILGATTTALASTTPPEKPIWTKATFEAAARPYLYADPGARPDRRVEFHIGYVTVRTPIGPVRILYLPIAMPLRYNYPSPDWNQMPNAFVLTNTQIPQRPQPPKLSPEIKIEP
jgi:hypothetical protein